MMADETEQEEEHLDFICDRVLPFLDTQGIYHPEKAPDREEGTCYEDIFSGTGAAKDMPTLEMLYGVLPVVQYLGMLYRIPTPALNGLLQPVAFQQRLNEIVQFFAVYDNGNTVTAEDAFQYLRLHAIGGQSGDMRAWLKGLSTGRFFSADGTLVGTTRIVAETSLKNIVKNDKDYWPKPSFMFALIREFMAVRDALCEANKEHLCGFDYCARATLYYDMLRLCQVYLSRCLRVELMIKAGVRSADVVVSAQGLWFCATGQYPDNLPSLIKIEHECFAFVKPGWIQAIPVASNSHKGILRFFRPAANTAV